LGESFIHHKLVAFEGDSAGKLGFEGPLSEGEICFGCQGWWEDLIKRFDGSLKWFLGLISNESFETSIRRNIINFIQVSITFSSISLRHLPANSSFKPSLKFILQSNFHSPASLLFPRLLLSSIQNLTG
jgi:hypothetical protein